MTDDTSNRANFASMEAATSEDWAKVAAGKKVFNQTLPSRMLEHLQLLEGMHWGFAVDRLTHCLQSATLAHRAGMDEEYVVCALLHDVGYTIAPRSHSHLAAAVLGPFVSEENYWMIAHHEIFEGYYFQHHFGGNRNAREAFRGHPHFERTAHFCDAFDQRAFDPNFEAMPLEAFAPMLERQLTLSREIRLARANTVSVTS